MFEQNDEAAVNSGCSNAREQGTLVIKGIGASPGRVRGRAVVLLGRAGERDSVADRVSEQAPAVVVMLRPDTELLMRSLDKAVAFVFESGGRLCHAALVCLELSIPCVVGAEGLTGFIQDGVLLQVDGTTGVITRLDILAEGG